MKVAPIPRNEEFRLAELKSYHCLDTAADSSLDEITSLVCSMFDVPVCLISLLDKDRQWFKSKQGMDLKETHRDVSVCAHAILGRKVFEVADVLNDERFHDNPILLEGKIRFYAGAPLISSSGYSIGTLCIVDTVPRQLTFKEKIAMKVLSEYVMNILDFEKEAITLPNVVSPENVLNVNVLKALEYLTETDARKASLIKQLII